MKDKVMLSLRCTKMVLRKGHHVQWSRSHFREVLLLAEGTVPIHWGTDSVQLPSTHLALVIGS